MLPYAAKVTRTPWWILFCHRPAKFSNHCHTMSHISHTFLHHLRQQRQQVSSYVDGWGPPPQGELETPLGIGDFAWILDYLRFQIQIQIHGIHEQIMEYCGQQCFGYFWIPPNTGLVRLVNLCTAFFDLPR